MSDNRVTEVRGTIVLDDGTESEFSIGTDGGWHQWGAAKARLGRSVDAMEAMTSGLLTDELLTTDEDEDEDESTMDDMLTRCPDSNKHCPACNATEGA